MQNGKRKEVQPNNPNAVQVIFDYKDNQNLMDAEQAADQDVKVLHLEDNQEDEKSQLKSAKADIQDIEIEKITDVTNEIKSQQ